MTKLNEIQLQSKVQFINDYINAENAASGSKFDQNANVNNKNIATLSAEINKDINIQINRHLVYTKLKELYNQEIADKFLEQLKNHEIYVNDETSLMPYCCAITLYPFLLNGLKGLGGDSEAPKHLSSFCGEFINLVFAVAAQFAGAVATVEFLMYFDYFARKDYGENYLENFEKEISQELQSVVYALNQPAAARGYQACFWNISIYDKPYFEGMFGNFAFPDFTKPDYESVNKLQKFFMKWFNKERTKAVLTFPVVTAACLNDNETMIDKEFQNFIAQELSEGNSFFIFTDSDVNSLSSCCFEGTEKIKIYTDDDKKYNITLKNFIKKFNLNEGKIEKKYKIKSLNPETLEIEDAYITGILKKKNEHKKLIKITINDKTISVTPDHKFLVKEVETGEIKEIQAFELVQNKEKYLVPTYE